MSSERLRAKFEFAFHGVVQALKTENTFRFQLAAAAAVIAVSSFLGLTTLEWALVIGAIGIVIVAEMINTAFELLGKYVTQQQFRQELKLVLDISAGAVLVASLLAAAIGILVLGPRLLSVLRSLFAAGS